MSAVRIRDEAELQAHLQPGDVIANCSGRTLNPSDGSHFLTQTAAGLAITSQAADVTAERLDADQVRQVCGTARLALISEEEQPEADQTAEKLEAAGVPVCHLRLYTGTDDGEKCDASDFMDEEDSEAVAERLRQLGYI